MTTETSAARTPGVTDRAGLAVAVFFLLLWARALFAGAGADAGWAGSAGYRGDADLWLEQVLASRAGVLFEAGVPLRPPGMPWLVDQLWDGTPEGIAGLKAWWRIMGAGAGALLFLALARPFGLGVALTAAALFGLSNASLHVSGSINVEAPYLLIAVGSMLTLPLGGRWSPGHAALFGLLSAAACLLRAEHLVIALLLGGWAAARRGERSPLAAGAAVLTFVAALAPAHLALWEDVRRFNAGEHPTPEATEAAFRRIERRTGRMVWSDEARAAFDALPAFARRSSSLFVADTVRHRGRNEVTAADIAILDEAFGARPAPLAARPFVSSSGPLNLWLANGPGASPSFGRGALMAPPPLEGGAERYPAELVAGLPPERLSLEYVPHLDVFNHGVSRTLAHVASDPAGWAGLGAAKLAHAWRGASAGLGGHGLPAGGSGTRRPVDLVVNDGLLGTLWSLAVLAAAISGLVLARREKALTPWVLLLVGRFALAAVFYGYARQGALALPAVSLLVALALARLAAPRVGRRAVPLGLGLVALLLLLELLRANSGVEITVDGAAVGPTPPVDAAVEAAIRYD